MPDAATLLAAVVPAAAPAAATRPGADATVDPAFGKLLLASASLGTADVSAKADVATTEAAAVKEAALPAAEDAMLRLMLAKLSDVQDQGTKPEPPPPAPDTIAPSPLAALLSDEQTSAADVPAPAKAIDPQPELSPADAAQAALASVVAPPLPPTPAQPAATQTTADTSPELPAPEIKAAAASPAPAADGAAPADAAAAPAKDTPAAPTPAPAAPANVSAEIAKALLPTTADAASQALTAVLSQLEPGAKTEPVTLDKPPKAAAKGDASTAPVAKTAFDAASAETRAPTAAAQGPTANLAASAATRVPTQIHPAANMPISDVAYSGSFDAMAPQNANGHAGAAPLDPSLPVVVVRAPAASNPMLAAQLPTSQIAVAIARQMRQGANHFEIRLDPPELGRIDVRMEVSHEGRVMASLAADRPETLDLLQRDARALQRAFADAGLQTNADSLNFSLRDGSTRQGKDFDDKSASLTGRDGATDADPLPAYAARLEPGRLDLRV